jgi:hypothetical protein
VFPVLNFLTASQSVNQWPASQSVNQWPEVSSDVKRQRNKGKAIKSINKQISWLGSCSQYKRVIRLLSVATC